MPNRLAQSTSPYLLQHADNPVDWYEWGAEAMAEAARRNVPILLSVGYSACHWCHVMAHESFEDPATAEEMNRFFVNVKVDREERPDVDSIYMEAVQAMTGQGGWPMTLVLTPDGRPFFAGTYFPKSDRGGLPSFRRVLSSLADAWKDRRQEVVEQAGRVNQALVVDLPVADSLPSSAGLLRAYAVLRDSYDSVNGGFSRAPKFPQQPALEFLLRIWDQSWAPEARAMVHRTLLRMSQGGIQDHLAGGFARYSVDERWLVPHFEKMLYDNAQLARIYLWAGIEFDEPEFIATARTTLDYLLNDLCHAEGGFFSAEDADSEGVEGRFYVWEAQEFLEVSGDDGEPAAKYFGVSEQGNFEGHNILHVDQSTAELAQGLGVSEDAARESVNRARARLLQRRTRRVRPGLDDKVLAAWNGLAIRALAETGAALSDPRYLAAAQAAARFILTRMRGPVGGLVRAWAKGRAGVVPGFLDDYAAMAIGLFSLYAATGDVEWFEAAADLTRQIPSRFGDPEGGLYSSEPSELPKRPKDQFDNPSPSGTSLAAEAMLFLSLYTGDEKERELAEEYLRSVGMLIDRYPTAAAHALAVIASLHRGTYELAVVGEDAAGLARPYWQRLRPHIALATARASNERVPLLMGRGEANMTLAYLCSGFVCKAPVSSAEALTSSLEST
jgi:uncharacterized protein YyaL (SSP411 family)